MQPRSRGVRTSQNLKCRFWRGVTAPSHQLCATKMYHGKQAFGEMVQCTLAENSKCPHNLDNWIALIVSDFRKIPVYGGGCSLPQLLRGRVCEVFILFRKKSYVHARLISPLPRERESTPPHTGVFQQVCVLAYSEFCQGSQRHVQPARPTPRRSPLIAVFLFARCDARRANAAPAAATRPPAPFTPADSHREG